MTNLRTAAQQALEALQAYGSHVPNCDHLVLLTSLPPQRKPCSCGLRANITALRAALAEPVQEPVWVCPDSAEHRYQKPGHCEDCGKTLVQVAGPVQEPVAWRWGYRSVTTGEMDWRGYVDMAAHPNLRSPEIIMEPLYTAPTQRKPLTEGEISNIWDGHVVPVFGKNGINPIVFARAIERAHGIKPTGCDHCNHPLYAAVKCKVCGRAT